MILVEEGLVYACGNNSGGQLGIKQQQDVKTPTLVEDLIFDMALNDTLKVTSICCANSFTLATTSKGQAFSWGTNLYGALGLGQQMTSTTSPVLIQTLL